MYQLYYAPDNASLIVRIVLEELGVPYTTVLVDRSIQGQQSSDYLALNPNGLIPVCVMDNQPVYETGAIILALAERHQKLAPLYTDKSRPQFLKWLFYLSNSLHTDLRQLFYPHLYTQNCAAAYTLSCTRLKQRLTLLNGQCRSSGSPYMMGDQMSILDIYLATLLRWVQLYPIDAPCLNSLDEYPGLARLCEALEQNESVRRACAQEGIESAFFNSPNYASPSVGSAT